MQDERNSSILWFRLGIDTLTAAVGRNAPHRGSDCKAALPPDDKSLGPEHFEDAARQEAALDIEGVLDGGGAGTGPRFTPGAGKARRGGAGHTIPDRFDRQPARESTFQLNEIGMPAPEGTADIDHSRGDVRKEPRAAICLWHGYRDGISEPAKRPRPTLERRPVNAILFPLVALVSGTSGTWLLVADFPASLHAALHAGGALSSPCMVCH